MIGLPFAPVTTEGLDTMCGAALADADFLRRAASRIEDDIEGLVALGKAFDAQRHAEELLGALLGRRGA